MRVTSDRSRARTGRLIRVQLCLRPEQPAGKGFWEEVPNGEELEG